MSYPILEYDPNPEALIEAARIVERADVPEHCVLCFFQEVIDGLVAGGRAREVCWQRSEMGRHPIYELEVEGQRLALAHPGIGAPLGAGLLEEVIARGCRKFIVCGSCGVLQRDIVVGHLVVPVSAVRDEGTSYHYLPPAREVAPTPAAVAAIQAALDRHEIPYILGKTWTTDAIYRETPARIRRRAAEGCVTVEMEAAAFFAVAAVRGVSLGQILYGGDDISGDVWDARAWHYRASTRERLFWLAAEACLALS